MKSFKETWVELYEAKGDKGMYALISSPMHIGYFLTIKSEKDLFSDEVKVIASDNNIDIDNIDITKLFAKFNKEFS